MLVNPMGIFVVLLIFCWFFICLLFFCKVLTVHRFQHMVLTGVIWPDLG